MQSCDNCCYSQSMNTNDNIKSEIKKEHKIVWGTTETREETTNKYTIIDYSVFILVICLVGYYFYFIFKTNLVGFMANQAISGAASRMNIKICSFSNFTKKVEKIMKSLSLCFNSRRCKYYVGFASASITSALVCNAIYFATLLILLLGNVESLPYLEFIVTAFVSLLLCT